MATCSKFRKIKCLWHVNFIDLILWDGSCINDAFIWHMQRKSEFYSSVFQGLSPSRSVGRVGENPGNQVVRTVVQEMRMRCTVSDLSLPWSLLMEEDGAILFAKMKRSLQDFRPDIWTQPAVVIWPFIMIGYSFNLCLSIDRRRCIQILVHVSFYFRLIL